MLTDVEIKVIELLKRKSTQPDLGKKIIRELDESSREALCRIAKGEVEVEHEKIRSKAISALSFLKTDDAAITLKALLSEENPLLKIKAIQAYSRVDATPVEAEMRTMITQEDQRPDLALAAARITARIGGEDIAEELIALRDRLLELAPSESSPSIVTLDNLIKQAQGEPPEEIEDDRVPIA